MIIFIHREPTITFSLIFTGRTLSTHSTSRVHTTHSKQLTGAQTLNCLTLNMGSARVAGPELWDDILSKFYSHGSVSTGFVHSYLVWIMVYNYTLCFDAVATVLVHCLISLLLFFRFLTIKYLFFFLTNSSHTSRWLANLSFPFL